jgi:hypothetical protein
LVGGFVFSQERSRDGGHGFILLLNVSLSRKYTYGCV